MVTSDVFGAIPFSCVAIQKWCDNKFPLMYMVRSKNVGLKYTIVSFLVIEGERDSLLWT
jgi:hypothetical protein